MKKQLAAIGILALGATLTAAPLAASADPWPGDDTFIVGDAQWLFDQYGIAYGWDAADVYGSSGYIYYPNEYFDDNDYLYCGGSGSQFEASMVTTQANGDITIVCPAYEAYPGLSVTMKFRLYAAYDNGWLLRHETSVANTTGADISFDELLWDYQYPTYVYTAGPGVFLSSSGETASVATDDDWFIAGNNDGSSVFQTTAWSKTGSSAAYGIESSGGPTSNVINDYTQNVVVPANTTLNLLQFTNMSIPETQDLDGAEDAFVAANLQTEEFSDFCGRLIDGLDPSIDYVGWGTPCQAAPALAATGADASQTLPIAVGGVSLLLLGAASIALLRRRQSVS